MKTIFARLPETGTYHVGDFVFVTQTHFGRGGKRFSEYRISDSPGEVGDTGHARHRGELTHAERWHRYAHGVGRIASIVTERQTDPLGPLDDVLERTVAAVELIDDAEEERAALRNLGWKEGPKNTVIPA